MRYLLDTNVLSELRKPPRRSDPVVREWIGSQTGADLALSVVTIFEIELGIQQLARRDIDQAQRLQRWLEDEVIDEFAGRTLSLDITAMRTAAALHVPDPRPDRDSLIAATALDHGLTVVTRNVKDFEPMGVPVIDPWNTKPR